MGLTDKHLAYGDDIPQTQTEKDYYWKINYQQSCDDCISRQAVLDSFWKLDIELRPCAIDTIVNMINNLPPVTPKEKTGKWIDDYKNEIDDEHECSKHFYRCSECGKYADQFVDGIEDLWDTEKPNFCPNCGAKMVEPQESEDTDGNS